jgi:toxin FitB
VNYLIDIDIISEVRKGERCNGHVAAWFASIDDHDGELRQGLEQ